MVYLPQRQDECHSSTQASPHKYVHFFTKVIEATSAGLQAETFLAQVQTRDGDHDTAEHEYDQEQEEHPTPVPARDMLVDVLCEERFLDNYHARNKEDERV